MGSLSKKIHKNIPPTNNPDIDNIKKRIEMLVNMQIEALQTKIDILKKCKADAANATELSKLLKVYQDLVEMVQVDKK